MKFYSTVPLGILLDNGRLRNALWPGPGAQPPWQNGRRVKFTAGRTMTYAYDFSGKELTVPT